MHSLGKRLLHAAIVAGAVVLAAPAVASRLEYTVRAGDAIVPGAEVCFFPAGPLSNFLEMFLRSGDVRCLPADKIVHMPGGSWNVFAEAKGLVSAHRLVTEVSPSEDRPEDELFHRSQIDLLPAAYIDVTDLSIDEAAGERVVAYLQNEGLAESRAAIRPARPLTHRIAVPANVTVVPLIVRQGHFIWAGPPRKLRPGEHWHVRRSDAPARTVVAVLTVPRELLPATRPSTPPPEVDLFAAGRYFAPDIAIRPTPAFADSLLFFRNVPIGGATISLRGADWISAEAKVTVSDNAVAVAAPALVGLQKPQLHAVWSLSRAALIATEATCEGTPATATTPEPITLRLLSCPEAAPACSESTATELAPADHGEQIFSRLDRGRYKVELKRGRLSASSTTFQLDAMSNATVRIDLAPLKLSGRLTRAGSPLHATLRFRTATAVSDAVSGEYETYSTDAPGFDRVRIAPCSEDRTYIHVPAQRITADARYDIDLPSNSIHVQVTDARNNGPLPDALVVVNTLGGRTGDTEVDQRDLKKTDPDGRTDARDVSANADVTICAYKTGFKNKCTERRRLEANGDTKIDLALEPKTETRGKLLTTLPVVRGRLFVVRQSRVLAFTTVAQDGTFSIDAQPMATDIVYFTAQSHALHMLRLPGSDLSASGVIELPVPAEPTRTFQLSCPGCAEESRTPFTLMLGTELVPMEVFAAHQTTHAGQYSLRKNESTIVPDVPADMVVTVIRGLARNDVPPQYASVTDQFAVPELLRTFAKIVATSDAVAFP
jgi:hypothetical protein